MEPCLAATGADPTLPIVLAAALLALGAVIAVVAIRRGKAGAALLVLALPFLVGASLLGSASPALAQPGVPCPTPTPTPTCEPIEAFEALEDLDVTSEVVWYLDEGGDGAEDDVVRTDLAPEQVDAILSTLLTIVSLSPDVEITVTATVTTTEGGAVFPLSVDTDLAIEETGVSIPVAVWDEIIEDGTQSLLITIQYDYDDGCGGTLTTVITIDAPLIGVVG